MREKKIQDGGKPGLLSLSRSRPYHEVDTRGIESRSGESKEVTNVIEQKLQGARSSI